jgi:TIR domain
MIAISYRREDSTAVTGRLHDRLQAEFGKKNVFMDFDSIPYGVDFREHIRQTLERAHVVVAVIGPNWLGSRAKGPRRIDQSDDFVRLEIATALQRGIPIIPVLLDETPMPQPKNLPADLQGLAFRNALTLDSGVDFHHHTDRLIAGIRELAGSADSLQPTKTADQATHFQLPAWLGSAKVSVGRRPKLLLFGAAALLILVLLMIDWYVFVRPSRVHDETALSLSLATPPRVMIENSVPTPTASATPIPAETPSFAAAVAAPTLTPMATPVVVQPTFAPLPTPLNPAVTDEEVRAFVIGYYRAFERKDMQAMLAHYDDMVDFHTDGRRDQNFLRNEFMTYFQRWPVASFNVGDIRVVHSSAQNTVTAYFGIRFDVRDTTARRKKQGRATEQWTITKSFGALKIISEKETVYSGTPYQRGRP